ncbi:glycine zipper domain-containing protein [Flaviaesturariibacter amylovorans]|uniref:Glycine zipper domain-containing protein n=1 Tax=Flaviaesturariibacter amylovorans TaxID=1084520 RepID=A0ABP8GZP6_9BACT
MKQITLALCAFMTLSACNSNPTAPAQTQIPDTTGLSAYQLAQARASMNLSELDSTAQTTGKKPVAPQQVRYVSSPRPAAAATGSTGASNGSGTGTTGTPAKRGISSTAKGAIIGGVAGAAGGAIINKKNRVAGAVVGGLLGAGTGAVIGNAQDKKDGRN